jgi:hypothetical protein
MTCADTEEVGPVLPLHARVIHQPEKGLVHQPGRLQAVVPPLTPEIAARQAAQFVVDDGGQLVECL